MVDFKRVGAKRLLKLADVLFVADALAKKEKKPGYNQARVRHDCGTPACALGHFASYFGRRKDWHFTNYGIKYNPTNEEGTNAGMALFGVYGHEAAALFSVSGCGRARTGKQAAKFIRGFVKQKLKTLAEQPAQPTALAA